MLDQNITTLITSVLSVIGTLIAVTVGASLSNRYTLQSEKTKMHNAHIEELSTLIKYIVRDLANKFFIEDKGLKSEEIILEHLMRIRVIVSLYVPSLEKLLSQYSNSLFRLLEARDDYVLSKTDKDAKERFDHADNNFKNLHSDFNTAIKKLVK